MAHQMESSLDQIIYHTYQIGYSQHGDIGLDPDKFAAHIIAVVEKHLGKGAQGIPVLSFVNNLHTNDLYLTVACAHRSGIAWNHFICAYNNLIHDLASRVSPSANAARDLAATVLVDMFLPDRTGRSRIVSYEGRSSLPTWLRIIVSNRAINEREYKWNSVEHIESVAEIPDLEEISRIEASIRASRYERIVEDSLNRACRNLSPRERLVLMMRYIDGLQVSQIARLLGVVPSSISRHIDRIQKKLCNNVISILQSEYGLKKSVIEECLADLLENPYYSILGILKKISQTDR